MPDPKPAPTDLHVCMGLNSCSTQDKDGAVPLAGTGQCATVSHLCHGQNACRGQGACGYLGTPSQQGAPGDNSCRGNGSCASPINRGRVNSAGVNKGKSVWQLARQLFEQRMYDAGIPFGAAPGDGTPDDAIPPWGDDKAACGGCTSSAKAKAKP